MRLYKVKTKTCLVIETKWFWIKKQTRVWFTSKTKFIYADNLNSAKVKYEQLFYKPLINNEHIKTILECLELTAERYSLNMNFKLSFNQRIIQIDESIDVDNSTIVEDINYVKSRTTASDFRNWFINGETETNVHSRLEII